jgi:hypothetical protein
VALDDIPEHHDVHVASEQRRPVGRRGALRLPKATLGQVAPEPLVQRGAVRGPELLERLGGFGPGVAQRLAEAERVHQHLHGPAAQARGHLAGEEWAW